MKQIGFKVEEVSHQVEQGYNVLAFYNDDEYLFLQRLVEIGHKEDDGVYIEYKAPLHFGFDVIEKLELSTKRFIVTLKSPLVKLPEVMLFSLDINISEQDCQRYGELLRAMFSDRAVQIT